MENYKEKLKEQLKEIDSLITKTKGSAEMDGDPSIQRVKISKGNGCDQFQWVDKTTGKRRYVRKAGKDQSAAYSHLLAE